ncbi:MAG: HNH endonuclease [Paludibacteraceae bacterium]|nr:HNH endonuclease [Paludibacteraceae bacterium]
MLKTIHNMDIDLQLMGRKHTPVSSSVVVNQTKKNTHCPTNNRTWRQKVQRSMGDRDEHHLGIRAFDDNTKREVYERQQGICKICGKHFDIEQMEADHITPWKEGGRTIAENCQMLCRECNRRKSDK